MQHLQIQIDFNLCVFIFSGVHFVPKTHWFYEQAWQAPNTSCSIFNGHLVFPGSIPPAPPIARLGLCHKECCKGSTFLGVQGFQDLALRISLKHYVKTAE